MSQPLELLVSRMSRRARWVGWSVVVAMFASVPASATTMLSMDLGSLTRAADAVVRATVKKTESGWSSDRHRIYTRVTLGVSEQIKGSTGGEVTVLQPGGRVGDIGQRVDGLASFSEGEEVIVFLSRRPNQTFQVTGMAQGKFRVERSSDGLRAFVVREALQDAVLLDPATRTPVEPNLQPLELKELRAAVQLKATLLPATPGKKP